MTLPVTCRGFCEDPLGALYYRRGDRFSRSIGSASDQVRIYTNWDQWLIRRAFIILILFNMYQKCNVDLKMEVQFKIWIQACLSFSKQNSEFLLQVSLLLGISQRYISVLLVALSRFCHGSPLKLSSPTCKYTDTLTRRLIKEEGSSVFIRFLASFYCIWYPRPRRYHCQPSIRGNVCRNFTRNTL